MVIPSGELPALVFQIAWSQFEPASACEVNYAISPGIQAGRESFFRDILSVGHNANVGMIAEIECVESERESRRGGKGLCEGDVLCRHQLRLARRTNLPSIPRSSARHSAPMDIEPLKFLRA